MTDKKGFNKRLEWKWIGNQQRIVTAGKETNVTILYSWFNRGLSLEPTVIL